MAVTVADGRFAFPSGGIVRSLGSNDTRQPDAVQLPWGGFIVVWVDGTTIKAQFVDRAGLPIGTAFNIVEGVANGGPSSVSIAVRPDGGFVLTWDDPDPSGGDDSGFGIKAQIFDALGDPVGDAFQVNTTLFGSQQQPTVAVMADGSFVIAWTDQEGDSHGQSVQAQLFDAAGDAVGTQFLVNTTESGNQYFPQAEALSGGGFVISWAGVNSGFAFQVFDDDAQKVGGEVAVGGDNMWMNAIQPLPSGGFVIVYHLGTDLFGRIYGADGTAAGDAFPINTTTPGTQYMPSIAVLPTGEFLVTWRDATLETNFFEDGDIRAQLFDAAGARIGTEFFGAPGFAGQGQALDLAVAYGSGDVAMLWVNYAASPNGQLHMRSVYSTTYGTEGDDVMAATADPDFYFGLGGNDSLMGGDGDDNLEGGAGNDVLDGGAGNDMMIGGTGDDVYYLDFQGERVTELAGEGTDEVHVGAGVHTLAANVENGTSIGSNFQLSGNALDNRLIGSSSNNFLNGAAGADYMAGGAGDDTYRVDNIGDTVVENEGEGSDNVETTLVAYTLPANVEILSGSLPTGHVLTGNALANEIRGAAGDDLLDGGAGADEMYGYQGNDIYFVDDAADAPSEFGGGGTDEVRSTAASYTIQVQGLEILRGMLDTGQILIGGPTIIAGAGDDTLDGGQSMTGGLGNDIYYDRGFGTTIVEAAGGGVDTVHTLIPANGTTYNLAANVENLVGNPTGSMTLIGNALDNDIIGGDGDNVIDGSLGADTMHGLGGDDSYTVDNAGDVVDEAAGQGRDFVYTSLATYTLGANLEVLEGTSSTGQVLHGNDLQNFIGGGAGSDFITTGAGVDTVNGGDGIDTLSYAGHNVRINVSVDAPYFGHVGENFTPKDSFGTIEIVEGTAFNDSFVNNSVAMTFRGLGGDDVMQGGNEGDTLDGGAGADSMFGRNGNDVYVVDNMGDVITELAGEGIDEVRTSVGSKAPPERAVYVLPDFIENLTGTSAGAQGVRDNSLDNVIVMGNGHDLVVADTGGVDTINGGGGNDFVYHGDKLTAADTTNGGAGIDTISLLGDYGAGIIFTAANLIAVERMTLYTSLYLPGTGPNNYTITMNDANVAAGTEFFVTAASLQSNEVLTFNGSAETNGRFTVHGGGGADTIIGGAGGDFIIGNGGNDTLYGLGGTDFLIGGLGADLLRGGAGADRFVYQSTAQSTTGSVDRILDFQHVDRIDLTGIDANGNAGDGNSAFTFIGSDAFHNVAGELRAYQSGADWFVEGDVNGDGLADLVIQVTLPDATPMGAGDFFL